MKLGEVFGGFIFAGLVIFIAWILVASEPADRIIRSCTPIYYIGKPFSSLAKLAGGDTANSITKFSIAREKDCRFVIYDMFYSEEKNAAVNRTADVKPAIQGGESK